MRHLSEQELIDLAEGAARESATPHLQSCEQCRAQLNDLRSMLSEAADVAVPEPSPLFWDHLSARVRDAIADDPSPRDLNVWGWLYPAAVAASIALIALVTLIGGRSRPAAIPAGNGSIAVDSSAGSDDMLSLADDPSLTFIADMASDIDFDAAAEAGLTDASGTVDRAVLALTPDERIELQRILKEEMSKS